MLDVTKFAQDVHAVSVAHGWWEGERDDATCVALMCCEVAEAVEEFVRVAAWLFVEISACLDVDSNRVCRMERLMEIVGSIARWLKAQGVDFEKVLLLKHEYNKTRPYHHGGKRC